jgi:acetyl-CoA carboxylase biotin carboxylase subunit
MVEEHGLVFIGPEPDHIRLMGDKVQAKEAAIEIGLPVVPGSDGAVESADEAVAVAKEIGFPVLLKAASGGGGRGMKIARSAEELPQALSTCRAEAKAAFGDDTVYLEKLLEQPRHIEVQVLGDGRGNVLHFGERDCSLQRRHQKVLEEAPSPALNADARERIGGTVCAALAKLPYRSAGTVEFLFENGRFYFIEMNTRLQVEHPVTEMITGVDLVREQIRVAADGPLSLTQDEIVLAGHAIECRINAENPETFVPSPGRISDFHAPGGLGVRVDSALYSGYSVPPFYDSLVAKLIVHGKTRNECLMRLRRALEEFVIGGIETTIPLHERLVGADSVINGDYHIHWLEQWLAENGKG